MSASAVCLLVHSAHGASCQGMGSALCPPKSWPGEPTLYNGHLHFSGLHEQQLKTGEHQRGTLGTYQWNLGA